MYELTQVEKCKKMGPLSKEFERLHIYNEKLRLDQIKYLTRNIKRVKE